MSILDNIQHDDKLEGEEDKLGGFSPLATGLYKGVVKYAYLGQAASGSMSLSVAIDINGREYRETIYFTNKAGQTFYINKDKEKKVLPGFPTVDGFTLLTSGVGILKSKTEKKIINLYNSKAKRDMPTEVDMLVDTLGKTIQLGILQVVEFKSEKDEETGIYYDIPETRTSNTISKLFHGSNGKTVPECVAKVAKAEFIDQWTERYKTTVDKTKGKTPNLNPKQGGSAGLPNNSGVTKAAIDIPDSNESVFN